MCRVESVGPFLGRRADGQRRTHVALLLPTALPALPCSRRNPLMRTSYGDTAVMRFAGEPGRRPFSHLLRAQRQLFLCFCRNFWLYFSRTLVGQKNKKEKQSHHRRLRLGTKTRAVQTRGSGRRISLASCASATTARETGCAACPVDTFTTPRCVHEQTAPRRIGSSLDVKALPAGKEV